ncbi:hypothetical protein K461DRAFT_227789 [Myriangium duriaei CBS 260.36]|uniref:CST complex subunit Stn1 N-terminal domain-containing protein n=1 Tax=Myriangium duriaei CBS 260.36 TaxID=1168546 RepID=A0A9P4IY63_9PEZI|nr:hypothetical protein K461DRAFT_227789 [Myriangium duriaei CBS 260.36]
MNPSKSGAGAVPPAKYWHLSPTYPHWAKLSLHDLVHTLRPLSGYEGQDVLFYASHPIRYVYLVAVVVGIDLPSASTAILVLDDSSGACVEAVVRSPTGEGEVRTGVTVVPGLTRSEEGLMVEGLSLGPGTVVKAKGIFSNFRGVRQVELKRLSVLKDTREEAAAWRARAGFKAEVLEKPWTLGVEERAAADTEIAREAAREKLVAARERLRKKEREKKRGEHEKRKVEREEKREMKRREEEREMDAGALV